MVEFEALVPATSVINDVLFTLQLNQMTAEWILQLLNHMFSAPKETHVYCINWKKPEENKNGEFCMN